MRRAEVFRPWLWLAAGAPRGAAKNRLTPPVLFFLAIVLALEIVLARRWVPVLEPTQVPRLLPALSPCKMIESLSNLPPRSLFFPFGV